MKFINRFYSLYPALLLALVFSSLAYSQQNRMPDFGLYDQTGAFHQLSRFDKDTLLLLVLQANADPASRNALRKIGAFQEQLKKSDVKVMALNASDNNREAIQQELLSLNVELPVLIDSAGIVTRSLETPKTGEAYIIQPEGFEILFRGSLNSLEDFVDISTQLEGMLSITLTDSPNATSPAPYAEGKLINPDQLLGSNANNISYQDDIAPILIRRCATCHIEDGLAPWAMNSHRMIQGWSPMIREVLMTRRMPPGQIDITIGRWHDIHSITDYETGLLVKWIDEGAKKAEGNIDPLSSLHPVHVDWTEGEPDLVIKLPENEVPATGSVDFIYSRVHVDIDADKWVKAIAYNVDGVSVLHSLVVASSPSSNKNVSTDTDPMADSEFMSLYVPGRTLDSFPPDSGMLLKKGTDLLIKTRYLTSGRATSDETQIGFYFYESKPSNVVFSLALENTDFVIPANVSDYQINTLSEPLKYDARIESISPILHSRGKSVSIFKVLSGETREKIFSMPNYNYNWQMSYRLEVPKTLPAGARLQAITSYDNSLANPFNLDPTSSALRGPSDKDEALTHYIRLLKSN